MNKKADESSILFEDLKFCGDRSQEMNPKIKRTYRGKKESVERALAIVTKSIDHSRYSVSIRHNSKITKVSNNTKNKKNTIKSDSWLLNIMPRTNI